MANHLVFSSPLSGLRQGCPLSPYLFLLCSQGLSSLMKIQSVAGGLKRVRCARNAPTITHLFFADDTLLFGQTDNTTCNIIREMLKKYEEASGQVINIQKSSITFSPNKSDELKTQVFSKLNMIQMSLMSNIWVSPLSLEETNKGYLMALEKKCGKNFRYGRANYFRFEGGKC